MANPTIHVNPGSNPSGPGSTARPSVNPTINISVNDIDPNIGGETGGGEGGYVPEEPVQPVEEQHSEPVAQTGYEHAAPQKQSFRGPATAQSQAAPSSMDATARAQALNSSFAEAPQEQVTTDGFMDEGKKRKREQQPSNEMTQTDTHWWSYDDNSGKRVHATKAWGPWEYYEDVGGKPDIKRKYEGTDRRTPTEPTKDRSYFDSVAPNLDDYEMSEESRPIQHGEAPTNDERGRFIDRETGQIYDGTNPPDNPPPPPPGNEAPMEDLGDRYVETTVAKAMFDNPATARQTLSSYRQKRDDTQHYLADIGLDGNTVDSILDDMTKSAKQKSTEAASKISKEESRRRASERKFAADYHSGTFDIEGQRPVFDEASGNYYMRYSPVVEDCIKTVCNYFGWDAERDTKHAFQILRLVTGYSKDRDAQLWTNNDPTKNNGTEDAFESFIVNGTKLLAASMTESGHPFKFTRANVENMGPSVGGLRFPVGVVPWDLAVAMTENPNSALYNVPPQVVQDVAKTQWLDAKEKLRSYCVANRKMDKIPVYEDMVRALCAMDSSGRLNAKEFGVDDVGDGFARAYEANIYFRDALNRVDPEHANQVADAELERYNKAVARRSKSFDAKADPHKKKRDLLDKDGNKIGEEEYYTGKAYDEIASFGLGIWRMLHTVGNIPLMISSPIEQAKGLFESKVSSWQELWGKEEYAMPHDWFKDLQSEKEFLDAANAAQLLIQVGDNTRDLLLMFAQTGQPMTTANAQAFINKQMPEATLPRLKKITDKAQKMADAIMVGDIATAKPFARQLINNFQVEQSKIDGVDGATMAEALNQNPIEVFTEIAKSEAFWSAYHRTVNGSYKRISPASCLVKSMLGKNGMTDLFASWATNSPFFNFAVQMFEAWFPMSNTIEYMATYGLVKAGKVDKVAMEASIGGMGKTYEEGLKMCIRYDLLRFGGTALQAFAHLAIISAFGGPEPPDGDDDDPDEALARMQDYRYWKLPNPITGEKEPVMISWWLDDLTQWSIPVAIGISAAEKSGDPGLGFLIAYNGCLDMMAGNKVMQGMEALADLGEACKLIALGSGDKIKPPNMESELTKRLLHMFSDPMIISQFHDMLHQGDFERDIYKKKDGTSRTNLEAQINSFALNNDLFGGILGLFTDYGWEGSALRTEHDKDEELMAKEKGFAKWCERTGMSMDDKAAQDLYAQQALDALSNYDTVADAVAAGWRLSKQDANYLSFYINDQISELTRNLDYLAVNDPSSYYATKDSTWAQINMLSNKKKDIFYDNMIYDPDMYNVLYNTQVNAGHRVDENGKKIYIDYGNKAATPLSLWVSPDEGSTNVDNDANMEIKFRDIHVTKDGTAGNKGDYRTEKFTNDNRTADGRYWIPAEHKTELTEEQIAALAAQGYNSAEYQALPFDAQLKVDAAIQKANKDKLKETAAANKSSGGTSWSKSSGGYSSKSYSSGGGGGSSANYSPKIYNMKGGSLSVNKPASMYTKTPYSANKSYLSPDFQTAGSRNAYKRSEY